MRKPKEMIILPKSQSVEIAFEGSEGSDEDVESEIEFASADEKRIIDVFGDDVSVFRRRGRKRVRPRITGPFLKLNR